MRFEAVEIRNFRQYKALDLNFKCSTEWDLHIIEGANGMGKTNILNAIAWCLYGIEPHLGDESRSLPKLNLEAKNEALDKVNDICIISVKIYACVNDTTIMYERRLPVKASTKFEQEEIFTVTVTDKNGDCKIYEGKEANEYVNLYMPEKIREYFYFDGEQLHNYFITDQSSKIRDSIHAVSQVELLTSIKGRLQTVINDKQKEAGNKNPNISKLNGKKVSVAEQIEKANKDMEELNNQITESEKIIKINSEYLSGQEDVSELEKQYKKLEGTINRLFKEKQSIIKEFNKFIRDYKIILTFYPSVKKALHIIEEKESKGLLPPNIDKQLLESILEDGKCFICENGLDENGVKRVKELLDLLQVSSATSHLFVSIKEELENYLMLAEEYPDKKQKLFNENKKTDESIKQTKSELDDLDKKLKSYSDKEKIVSMHEERLRHKDLLNSNLRKLGVVESNLKKLEEDLKDVEKELDTALSKQKECEDINGLIKFAGAVQRITQEIEQEMMDEVREKIRVCTMDYFSAFIWKKDTYDCITLDDSYRLDLIHKEGYSCVGSCSAAERSLLALSFTLALHEVSGFNSLLFIDTPVARVSDINRNNFAKILKEVSKNKQIIMTFAPSEYSEEIKEIFEPVASSSIKLITHNERVTEIK